MIEKKRPRVLNSSKDSRVRGPEEMYDALNINASSDYGEDDEGGVSEELGDLNLI